MSEGINTVLRRNLFTALQSGELDEAALLLARLQEEDPLSESTRSLELNYLLRRDRLADAKVLAEQLLRLFPDSARIQYLAGRVAYRHKDYSAAADRFREAQRLQPHWRSAWNLAKSLTQLAQFTEATALLESLLPAHPECYLDLAWLYERQEHYDRALEAIDNYLKVFPKSEWAQAQQQRLRARSMDPQELIRETECLREFGEEVSEPVAPQFLEALFRTGQSATARQFVADSKTRFGAQTCVGLAWICYRYQSYELALDLFLNHFRANRGNPKFLAALEFAAQRCNRVAELLKLYHDNAADDRRLYGRIQSLKRRAGL